MHNILSYKWDIYFMNQYFILGNELKYLMYWVLNHFCTQHIFLTQSLLFFSKNHTAFLLIAA